MPFEKIEIKISKKGEIVVRVENSDEISIRNLRTFLEEVLGPISYSSRLDIPAWELEKELAQPREEELERQKG
ncbi:MAG: hypothetical protein N2Z21_05670 [Candidatus Sumerlaeaceae bacterium]|nr:hypothetical protein [Candidatus Sumerlaeaceae bacterium]